MLQTLGNDAQTVYIWFDSSYRPQRICGQVMSLHLSVILFTGGSLSQHAPQVT